MRILKHTLLLLTGILVIFKGHAQIQINVLLQPPYSPYFSDYLTYENKTIITFVNPGAPTDVYLAGSVTRNIPSVIKLETKSGYKPAVPISLNTGTTVLSGYDIAQYFDWNNINIQGISVADVMQNNGLPEGDYTVCLKAFSWATNAQVSNSGSGCFTFPLIQVEPPVVIFPTCDGKVFANAAQNFMFSWSPTPGSPANTHYIISMAPMPDPSADPNNILNSLPAPPFYEKDVTSVAWPYTISDPKLVPGQTYAWRVTAYDPAKKTLFRNNGMSQACKFVYTQPMGSDTLLIPADKKLQITNPGCPGGKLDSMPVSADDPAVFKWSWADQLLDTAFANHPEKVRVNGKGILKYEVVFRKTDAKKVSKKPSDPDFHPKTITVYAPVQKYPMSFEIFKNSGFIFGQSYKVKITAFDSFGLPLLYKESCDFIFTPSNGADQPGIDVKGKMVYRFAGDNVKYPANYTTFTLQMRPDTLYKISSDPFHKMGWSGSRSGVTDDYPFGSFTTDANGNFTGKLNIGAGDTGKRFIRVTMNSPYYRPVKTWVPVDMSYKSYDSVSGTYQQYGQLQSLNLGEILLNAYDYTLNVTLKKGYPTFFYDTLTKNVIQNNSVAIDTMTINSKSTLKAGIPVALYRKSKQNYIPFNEAGKFVGAFEDKGSAVKIAEANTFQETIGGKVVTKVNFKLLVCNLGADDRYYIKAILPGDEPSSGGGKTGGKFGVSKNVFDLGNQPEASEEIPEELTAPLQEVVFDKKVFKASTYHYEQALVYYVVSKTPPLSKISGKLVYKWPSDPNVIRPLSNAKFRITLRYTIDGEPYGPKLGGDACHKQIYKLVSGDPNKDGYYDDAVDIPTAEDGLTVGTGTTDAEGNFTLYVINHNQKGTVTLDAHWQLMATIPTCQNETKKEDPLAKKKGYPDDDWSFGQNEWNQWDNGMNKGFDKGGSQNFLDFSYNGTQGFDKGFGGAMNGGMNNLLNGAAGMNFGGATNKTKGMNKSFQGNGPMPETEEIAEDDGPIKVTRQFRLELESPWSTFYHSPGYGSKAIGNYFVAQAFETKDLGTFTALVDEVQGENHKITVSVYGSDKKLKNDFQLGKAKLVIFRMPDAKTPGKPLGEGSDVHPMKELLKANFSGYGGVNNLTSGNVTQKMEWILEAPLEIGINNIFNIGDKKILTAGGKYYVQISPDPQNAGATFQPVIFPFYYENVDVKLFPSRYMGRVFDKSSTKGVKSAKVTFKVGSKSYSGYTIDTSGYFECINNVTWFGGSKVSWAGTDWLSSSASADGYKPASGLSTKLNVEGAQFYQDLQLNPAGVVNGIVVDEKGNPLDAYVMRDDSTIFETLSGWLKGGFIIPVTSLKKHNFTIIPKDVGYFDTTIKNYYVKDGVNALNKVTVFRRKHRIFLDLKLFDKDMNPVPPSLAGLPSEKFKLTVNNDSKLTSLNGHYGIYIEFENVSVNNYSMLIEDVKGGGYIPKLFNLKNNESKEAIHYTVNLVQGESVDGKVTLDGVPVKNARVYLKKSGSSGSQGSGAAYSELEARTDAQGKYVILGIPSVGKVTVYATLDTSFTVIGSSKLVDIAKNRSDINLELKSNKDIQLKSIFGFPVSIEKLEKISDGYMVSGLVDLSKNQGDFTWLDPNTKLRFSEVKFQKNKAGNLEPVDDFVLFYEVQKLKMRYMGKYNVSLFNAPQKSDPDMPAVSVPLSIRKEPRGGALVSKATIVDNSFNFPSSYLSFASTGEFYLAQIENGTLSTDVRSIYNSSEIGIVTKSKMYLSDKNGKALKFSFINFPTTADPAGSYISGNGSIHLKATMTGYIPNGQGSVNVEIPDLMLDNNEVKPSPGSAPLVFDLQSWKLEVRDWKVDPKEGGIISYNTLVKTKVVDVPVKLFNLRSDKFILQTGKINEIILGGGVLSLTNIADNATLVFDEKCGSDLGKHWRISVTAVGNSPAAIVPYNNQLKSELKLSYIQLISLGSENILSMQDVPGGIKNIYGNPLLTYHPKSLGSGADYFFVGGVLDISVPRILSVPCNLNFSKKSGALKMEMEPLDIQFEGKGYVKFKSDLTQIPKNESGITSIRGTVQEPGKMNPIPCKLDFGTGQPGRIYLDANYRLNLTSEGNASGGLALILSGNTDKNGCRVTSGDWNLLKFSGQLDDPQSGDLVKGKPKPIMDFEVHGEIQANSDGIAVNEISTPFGEASFTFDFASKELRGNLTIPDGTQMGTWTMGGQLETRFSPKGFIVCGNAQVNTGTLLVEGFGTFSMGFLLGTYSLDQSLIDKATVYSKDPKGQCWLQANKDNFKGFYFLGGYDVLNVKEGFDIAVASVYFHAVLGVECALGANFNNNSFTLRVGAHGLVEAGMNAITGTSIEGSLAAHVTASVNYKNGGFHVKGEANCTLGFEVCQSLIVEEVCWGESMDAGVDFGFGKGEKAYFNFHLGDAGSLSGCKPTDN